MAGALETLPFSIPRILFARLSAELYFRRFWWLLVPWVALGCTLVLLSPDPLLKAFGAIVAAWPLSIPARSFFITRKAAQVYAQPTKVRVEGSWLYFVPKEGPGFKLAVARISRIQEAHGYLALWLGFTRFALIGPDAFASDEARRAFHDRIAPKSD